MQMSHEAGCSLMLLAVALVMALLVLGFVHYPWQTGAAIGLLLLWVVLGVEKAEPPL